MSEVKTDEFSESLRHCSGYNAYQSGSGIWGGSPKQRKKRERKNVKQQIRKEYAV